MFSSLWILKSAACCGRKEKKRLKTHQKDRGGWGGRIVEGTWGVLPVAPRRNFSFFHCVCLQSIMWEKGKKRPR